MNYESPSKRFCRVFREYPFIMISCAALGHLTAWVVWIIF